MNRTQQAWGERKTAGELFMDVKSAFNNASKAHLGRRMEMLGVEPDLIRWTDCFISDRQVKLVLGGKGSPVDTGIPQGSPVAPILFVTYLSGYSTKWKQQCQASGAYPLWTTLGGGRMGPTTSLAAKLRIISHKVHPINATIIGTSAASAR